MSKAALFVGGALVGIIGGTAAAAAYLFKKWPMR